MIVDLDYTELLVLHILVSKELAPKRKGFREGLLYKLERARQVERDVERARRGNPGAFGRERTRR